LIPRLRSFVRAVVRALALFALGLGLIWPAAGAFAHASLVMSEPADGAVLRAAPTVVTLHFNEPVSPIVVSLVDAGGVRHSNLAVTPRGEILAVGLPSGLPAGTQTLSYRVISADGHTVGGVVAFSVGMPGGAASAAIEDVARAIAIWTIRWAI
jgi:copper transport protein